VRHPCDRKDFELKIETERQADCTLKLTVEVDDEHVQPALRTAARQLAKQHPLPGFRPGKAPYEVILRHFGEGALYESALDDLGQKVYKEALDQESIEAYGPASLDDVQLKPMVLKFTVPLRPEVEVGDYRALRVPYTAPEISDEAVQEAMEHMREHHAVLEPVDRPAALGDVVNLDVKGFLNTGENPSDFLLADKDVAALLDEKTDWPVPGFAPHIVGMRASEERKFDLTFSDDYANQSLRGQVAHFEVQCKEVKNRTLPEWSDELAKEMGEYQDLAGLRQRVREELVRQAERKVEDEYGRQVVEKLVEQAEVKFPPVLLEQELDDMVEDLDRRLREQRLTLEDYLKIESKTKEQLRDELKPQAVQRLKRALVLSQIVEREQLKTGPDEVEAEITRLSAPWGEYSDRMRRALSTDRARVSLATDLLANKAVQRLAAVARGEAIAPPEAASQEIDADKETGAEVVTSQPSA
jgi:trigger factor